MKFGHHFRNQQPDLDQKLSFSFTAFLMFSFDHTFTYGPGWTSPRKKNGSTMIKLVQCYAFPKKLHRGWNAKNLLFRMVQELTQKTDGRLWEYGFKVAVFCDVSLFFETEDTNLLGGGDSNIFYFHPYLGEIIEFDWYFSSGLKPSTSFLVAKHVKVTVRKMLEKLPWKMFRWFSMGFIIPGYKLGGGFKHSLFSPLVGEDSQFD